MMPRETNTYTRSSGPLKKEAFLPPWAELIRCSLRYLPCFHPKPQCSHVSCFKDKTVFVTFWQMVAEKVKGTHGAHCRGINPVENPCVSTVDPLGRDATKGFFLNSASHKESPPTSGPGSMKDSTEFRDAYIPFIHLQAPRSPFSTTHSEGKTNLAFNHKYLVNKLSLTASL